MKANEEIDYKLAAEQLRTDMPLFGKDGLKNSLTPFKAYFRYCCANLYRVSDTQLCQICGQQASERIRQGLEACLWRCQ